MNLRDLLDQIFIKMEPELSKAYKEDYHQRGLSVSKISIVLGIILYAAFGLLDIWIVPLSKESVWLIRFGIVIPILALTFLLLFLIRNPQLVQWLLASVPLIAGLGIVMMIAIAQPDELGYRFYFSGLFLTLIWIYTFVRLRAVYATTVAWLITLSYLTVLIWAHGYLLSPETVYLFINQCFFFVSANLLGMVAAFSLEHNFKTIFLQKKRREDENKKRLAELYELINSSARSLKIGERLINSSQTAETLSENYAHKLKHIGNQIETFKDEIQRLEEGLHKIQEAMSQIKSEAMSSFALLKEFNQAMANFATTT